MPSISRSLFVAVQAAALCAFFIASPAPVSAMAFASPMPIPLPLASIDNHALNLTSSYRKLPAVVSDVTRKTTRVKHSAAAASVARRDLAVAIAKRASTPSSKVRRADAAAGVPAADYKKLQGYYDAASTHAKNLKSLAAQSSSVQDGPSSDFHQQAATELTGFHSNLLGILPILSDLGADKGLSNYDNTEDLETLLKNFVNLNKDTLNCVTTITYNLPIVGSTLGPIVYDIKCVLDDILNAVENLTDAISNVILPLFEPLLNNILSLVCNNGVNPPTCLFG